MCLGENPAEKLVESGVAKVEKLGSDNPKTWKRSRQLGQMV